MRNSLKPKTAFALLHSKKCVCGGEYTLRAGSDTVWCSAECDWFNGSGFDVLAEHLGGYGPALEAAMQVEPWIATSAGLKRRLEAQRALLEMLRSAAGRNGGETMETINIREAFHRACDCRPYGALHFSATEMLKMLLLLDALGADLPPGVHDRGATIMAYWRSPHEVSCLHILPKGSRTFTKVDVLPTKFSWSGLNFVRPTAEVLDVYPNFIALAKNQDVYHTTLFEKAPVAIHCSCLSEEEAEITASLRFVCSISELTEYLPAWSHIPNFEESLFTTDPMFPGIGLREVLLEVLDEVPLDDFISMLGSLILSEETRRWLLEQTASHPGGGRIEECISRILLDVSDDVGLYRSVGGYEIARNGELSLLSNFTIDLKSIVGFERSVEIIYEAEVHMEGYSSLIEIPGRSLEKATALESAIRTGQIFSAPEKGNATVFDTTGMTRILKLLRKSTRELPRYRGYKALGWSHQQDQFVMTSSVVEKESIRPNTRYKPPVDSDFFPYTSVVVPEEPACMKKITPTQADLLSALISCVIRSFHGLPVRLLPVINNEKNRGILNSIFAGIGQTQPVRLTSILAKHVDSMRGYPCLISNVTEQQSNSISMCGVRFAERGKDLEPCKLPTGEFFAWALTTVTSALLNGADIGFKEKRSVSLPNSFAQEGQKVFEHLIGSWPIASAEWKTLDDFLTTRGKDLEHKAHVCFEEDTVVLHKEILEGIDVQDLTIELGLLCRRVQRVDDTIIIDRNTLYPVLEDFYGELPKIKVVRV